MDVNAIADLGPTDREALFHRDAGVESARPTVRDILDRVETEGDAALRDYAERFDDVSVGNIEITDLAAAAREEIDTEIETAIRTAAANIRAFHERQRPDDWRDSFDGRILGRRYRPLERVGVYVPGGTAAYPSSALMGIIPAAVAGVEHIAVVTPPADNINPVTLAAIHIAGADSVYQVGGAQGIGALAYGTETIPSVQKIVGPGNRYVAAAKAEVVNIVEIDFLAGPSELLVLCDETADPTLVAADMVAQAEHDADAAVVCVTNDEPTASAVVEECSRLAEEQDRTAQIDAALSNDASGILLARSLSEAILFAEEYAAEHLTIMAADPESILDRIDSAGSVFLGPHSPVAAGDYASGPNHVLPTGGLAKVTGGLSVDHFLRSTTVQKLDQAALADIRDTVTTLARAEGLEAHAASVEARFRNE